MLPLFVIERYVSMAVLVSHITRRSHHQPVNRARGGLVMPALDLRRAQRRRSNQRMRKRAGHKIHVIGHGKTQASVANQRPDLLLLLPVRGLAPKGSNT